MRRYSVVTADWVQIYRAWNKLGKIKWGSVRLRDSLLNMKYPPPPHKQPRCILLGYVFIRRVRGLGRCYINIKHILGKLLFRRDIVVKWSIYSDLFKSQVKKPYFVILRRIIIFNILNYVLFWLGFMSWKIRSFLRLRTPI